MIFAMIFAAVDLVSTDATSEFSRGGSDFCHTMSYYALVSYYSPPVLFTPDCNLGLELGLGQGQRYDAIQISRMAIHTQLYE